MLTAVYFFNFAAMNCEYIRDLLEIAGALEGREMPADAPLELTTDFYRRAAEANLNQFEAVVVEGRAKASQVPYAAMQTTIMREDENYLVTRAIMEHALPRIEKLVGTEADFLKARLGTAMQTYSRSSM